MKFKCYSCQEETTFNKSDYLGLGKKQQNETVIKFATLSSPMRQPKTKEIIINCDNPACRKPNKIEIQSYE